MPPRVFSLTARLWTTAFLALAGSAALLFVALRTIDSIKIRGPLYLDIVSYKDLLADILPPPAYLIESYLTSLELTRSKEVVRAPLLKKLEKLEADYQDRKTFWVKELKQPSLRQAMLDESVPPGLEFFRVLNADFIPAIKQGDLATAQKVFDGPLTLAYTQHRAAVDKTVDLANKEVLLVEAAADATLSGSTRTLLLAAIGINVLVLLLTFFSIRSILRPMSRVTTYAKRVSSGDYDSACEAMPCNEIGSLAAVLAEMVLKVKESLVQAADSERLAQKETQNARDASSRAEDARTQAEQAKQQGMVQAALRLEQVVEIMGAAAGRLATLIEQSNKGAQAQAQNAAEVASAMEEMNATVLEVARNATKTAETSGLAQSKANEGAQVVAQAIQQIKEVQVSALALKEQMTDLGRQSEGIGQVLNVISDIADQTNLLALNAAIEAARAGDAGRGFAVVADEVRKLAEKTMTATKQVGEAIQSVQKCTRANIVQVDQSVEHIANATRMAGISGQALQEIVCLVEAASTQVSSIAAAAEQQSSASEEINRAMEEVNTVAQESTTTLDDAARAVLDLSRQAEDLRNLILELKTDGTPQTA